MFEGVEGLLAEHAELERRLGAARDARRRPDGQEAQPAVRRADRDHHHLARVAGHRRRPGGRARARGRGPGVRRRGRGDRRPSARWPRSGCAGCWSRATRPTTRTRCWRSSPARAARSRRCSPATCSACTPGTPRPRGWSTEILDATESDLGGYKSVTVAVKAQGHRRAGPRAVRAAEVRGRRAPRPAGAGHRVAGPRPHQRRRRAGDARGRGRSTSRSTSTTCASTSSAAAGPAARASTPPTRPSGSPTSRPASW